MKRFTGISVILLAICAAFMLGMPAKAEENVVGGYCGGEGDGTNLSWSFDSKTGIMTISGKGAMAEPVPWADMSLEVKGLVLEEGLTTISSNAFTQFKNSISSVKPQLTLPSSLQSIGNSAFKSCEFTGSLTLSDSLQSIGDEAFRDCGFTGKLTLSNSLLSVGDNAFRSCNFTGSLVLPNSMQSIGNHAFSFCKFNGTLTLPNSIQNISEGAFHFCQHFTGSLTIPDSVRSIGDDAFNYCGFDELLNLPKSLQSIGKFAFYYCRFGGSLTLPDSLQSIGNYAFYHSRFTGSLILPESLQSIGESAFNWCNFTGTLTLPASLQIIGINAFKNSPFYSDIYVAPGNEHFSAQDKILFNKDKTVVIHCLATKSGNLALPNTVKSIAQNAFNGCKRITSVTVPESVSTIYNYSFTNCDELEAVYFKGDVPYIYWPSFDRSTVLYYIHGKTGWTTPKYISPDYPYDGYKCYPMRSSGGVITVGSSSLMPSGEYRFCVIDGSTKKPIQNAQVTYNGETVTTDANGYAKIANFVSGKKLSIAATGYGAYYLSTYTAKGSKQDFIHLRVDPYYIISAVMSYNNDVRDITSQRAVIDLMYKDTPFTIGCTVSESVVTDIKEYRLISGEHIIARSSNGQFDVTIGDFSSNSDVFVHIIGHNDELLSSTPLMLTVKNEKPKLPATLSLGKSIKFTVPSDVPLFGGNEMEVNIPVLPMTMDISENSIKIGVNFNIMEFNKKLTDEGKEAKWEWFKGFTKSADTANDLIKLIDETAKEIGSKEIKHRISKDFSMKWTIFGSAEAPLNIEPESIKGAIYIKIDITGNREKQCSIVPPIVIGLNFKGKVSIGGEFRWTVEDGFIIQVPVTLNPSIGIYGGLGGASLASVGIYGEGGAEVKLLLAGNKADSGLESWKFYGSVGVKAMLLRKEIFKIQVLNGEYYLYRRDTGGLKSMPAQPYMSPGRAFSELDSDLVYTTVARQQQSRWIGAAAPDVETIVVQPELSYIAEPVEATDTPAPTPETTPVEADMATQDPEPTPNPEPESTPVPDESSAPVQETEPLPVPSPSPTPTPELTSDIEQTPESTHDANEQLMAIGDMYTSRLSAHNIPSTSSNTMFAPQALLNLPSSPEALQVNSDTEIDPILVDCGDTLMMLYCDADATRPIEDCSKLVFSLLDTVTGQWTEPIAVWDDGTADYAPDAYATENGVYIVWQNAKTSINESDTLNEIGVKLEVSVAHFDMATRTFTVETITDNDCYEAMPNICLTADGMPVLTWAENAENDVLGLSATEQKPNRIYYMQKDESGWNEKLLLAEYDSIALSMDTGLTTNGVEVCVNLDTDNNLDTTTDRVILFAQPYKSTSYISGTGARYLDGAPLYLDNTTEDATTLYYNVAAMNTTFLPDTDYTAAVNADGNITLCWSITQDGKSNLYAMTYGAAESIWAEPIALTEADANHYHEKVACAYAAGKPIFVYVDQSISDTSAMDATAGLYWFAMPERESYTINSVIYDETAVKPGCALPLTIEITNTGTVSIDKLHATLIDTNGEIALEQDVPLALLSGCTGDAELMLSLPEEAQHMQYTLKLGNEEYSDIDIGRAMLITGNQVYKTDDEQTVIAYVKNIGLDTASGTFTVIDQENGAVVTSGNFSDLGYNDVFYLQFSISGMQTDWNLMLVAETDTLQTSIGGNTSYIKLYHENTFVLGDINQDGNVNILDLILLAKHIVGIKTLPSNQILLADINKDGILDLKDALMLCHYIAS